MSGSLAPRAMLLDLLMATMDSMSVWAAAAGDRDRGLAWRDAVTARMIAAGRYVPYELLVADAAADLGLEPGTAERLADAWAEMRPWPDARAVANLRLPYAFVTNCSSALATVAADRSGLGPAFTLSAEEAGWYKPRPEAYLAAVARLGVTPSDVLFVAGAGYDADGASAAGLPAVLVRRRDPGRWQPDGIALVGSLGEALAGLNR